MQTETKGLGSGRLCLPRRLFYVLAIFALVISMPAMTRASFAATGASITMSYSVNTSGSLTYITVVLSAKDSQFPSSVVVTMSSTYKDASTPYNSQTVTVMTGAGGSVSSTFNVPYEGTGNYVFDGSIATAKGSVIMSAMIDPLIEPEWR